MVIEWKTSQRTKATLEEAYDDPVQIAAYVGALNADDKYPFEVPRRRNLLFLQRALLGNNDVIWLSE